MKIKLLVILLLCFNISIIAENKDYHNDLGSSFKYSKKKTIDANFTLNEYYTLNIDGLYSDMIISTSNTDKISFHIVITGKADREDNVDKLLQNIDFEFDDDKVNNKLNVATIISISNMRKIGYEININITMPDNIKLNVESMYGDLHIDKLRKDFNLSLRYADLTADSLFADNIMDVMYGDIMVKYAKYVKANVRYGDIIVKEAENIDLDIMYGDSEFSRLDKLDGWLRYSELVCGSVNTTKIDIMYTDVNFRDVVDVNIKNVHGDAIIDNLRNKIYYSSNYGDLEIKSVDKNFRLIEVDANYSDIEVCLTDEHYFNYNIELSYGSISSIQFLEKYATRIIEKDYKSSIVGNYNDTANEHKLIVKGSYTDFSLDD